MNIEVKLPNKITIFISDISGTFNINIKYIIL